MSIPTEEHPWSCHNSFVSTGPWFDQTVIGSQMDPNSTTNSQGVVDDPESTGILNEYN